MVSGSLYVRRSEVVEARFLDDELFVWVRTAIGQEVALHIHEDALSYIFEKAGRNGRDNVRKALERAEGAVAPRRE